jgi:3'-5' exoribonuclease
MLDKEFLVSNVQHRQTRQGKNYISCTLTAQDESKISVDGKVWAENVDKVKESLCNGNIIKVKEGKEELYNNNPQLNITRVEVTGQVQWGLSLEEANELYEELVVFVETQIINEQARNLTCQTLKKYAKNPFFFQAPAAKGHHHSYPGGLLQHTREVCQMALALKQSNVYPHINWDIVFSACTLHDLGKIYDYTLEKGVIETTNRIKLTGHLVTTPLEIYDSARILGYEYTPVFENILHAVVAHHGRKEYGSPQEPATREAWIVHLLDMLSSRVSVME